MAANDTEPRPGGLREVPLAIWALGFVSLLMDVSSEIIHALLPIYLVSGLGASMVTVGLIEGVAEATASITKVFSGALSDWRASANGWLSSAMVLPPAPSRSFRWRVRWAGWWRRVSSIESARAFAARPAMR